MTIQKKQLTPSSVRWHAVVMNIIDGQHRVSTLESGTQKELKRALSELNESARVLLVVKGRAFKTKVQRSFQFMGGREEDVDLSPPVFGQLQPHALTPVCSEDAGDLL